MSCMQKWAGYLILSSAIDQTCSQILSSGLIAVKLLKHIDNRIFGWYFLSQLVLYSLKRDITGNYQRYILQKLYKKLLLTSHVIQTLNFTMILKSRKAEFKGCSVFSYIPNIYDAFREKNPDIPWHLSQYYTWLLHCRNNCIAFKHYYRPNRLHNFSVILKEI